MNIIEKVFPINSVTIYPKTAGITRGLSLKINKGQNKLIINNLPQDITEDSIRIEFEKNSTLKIIDLFSTDDYIEKFDENLFRKKELELKSLIDKKKELEVLIKNFTDDFNLFLNKKKLLDNVNENNFKPIDVNTWNNFFTFFDEKLKTNRDSIRKIIFEWIDLEQKIISSQNNLEKYKAYDQLKEHKIVALIESNVQKEEFISIHYLQANVKWHPAYTLRADINKKTLSVNLYAMITQTTGEDWENMDILLSTAIPLQNCDIPEIKSKIIKEKEAEIVMQKPQAQFGARRLEKKGIFPASAKSMAPAPAEMNDYYEEEEAEREEAYADENMPEQIVENRKIKKSAGVAGGAPAKKIRQEKASIISNSIASDSIAEEKPPKQIKESNINTEILKINNLITNIDKDIMSFFSLDYVTGYYNDLFNYLQTDFNPDKIAPAGKQKSVNRYFLNEISLLDSFGGYDYRYTVKSKKNHIPSFNIPSQIGVEIKELQLELNYITIPVEKEIVFLKANFHNKGENPFPAGPAQVFLENNLIGEITFPTLGQNERTSISLGIDKDIKVIRKENKKRETKGIVGKDIVTAVDIEIELISYKKENIKIEVLDRIPKTDNNDISIFNINYNPIPSKKTIRKILLWNITLEPNKKKMIKYSYSIKHPENFKLTMTYDQTPYFTDESEEK